MLPYFFIIQFSRMAKKKLPKMHTCYFATILISVLLLFNNKKKTLTLTGLHCIMSHYLNCLGSKRGLPVFVYCTDKSTYIG